MTTDSPPPSGPFPDDPPKSDPLIHDFPRLDAASRQLVALARTLCGDEATDLAILLAHAALEAAGSTKEGQSNIKVAHCLGFGHGLGVHMRETRDPEAIALAIENWRLERESTTSLAESLQRHAAILAASPSATEAPT